jgi:pyruvate dehydrogenase E1 component alpha subunit
MVAVPAPADLRRVLDDEGRVLAGAAVPALADDTVVRLYDTLLLVRIVDDRMMRLQRQGQLGFYMRATGEEATHAAVAALRPSDWVFPSYREHGAWFWRGYSVAQFVNQLLGNAADPAKGRQMPVHHAARWLNLVSISAPVGTQIPQAVGAAYAAKSMGKDDVSLVYFGDGAAATGEFHVGLNFAGVWKAPCVFLCRASAAAPSRGFAARARGYGISSARVDGNDALAVVQVVAEAAERARAGLGATLIEAVTHRLADDDTERGEAELWERWDPLRRLRGHLRARGLWTDAQDAAASARHNQTITDALAAADQLPPPPVESIVDDVYETPSWNLAEQRAALIAGARTKNPNHHG